MCKQLLIAFVVCVVVMEVALCQTVAADSANATEGLCNEYCLFCEPMLT